MPSIVKRGDSYRIFVSLKSDGNGTPVRKTTTFHPPQDVSEKKARFLAESYAYRYEEQLKNVSELSDSSSFRDLFIWYFDTVAPKKLKEHTLLNNRKLVENYVLPNIGHMKLREIGPVRIDGLITELLCRGGLKNHRPLTPGTVNLIRASASAVFSAAVKKGILSGNPVEGSTPPKQDSTEREFLTDESCRDIVAKIESIRNGQVRRALKILLYTGMRRGELLALHWRDVNFIAGELTVRYTLFRTSGKVKITSPKTKSSNRIIPVSDEVLHLLMEQYVCTEQMKKEAGNDWQDTDAVFVNRKGGYMNGEYLNNAFKKFLKENGFPAMHLHDLRHANASILINRGVPMKIVSEHLGHVSEKTTEQFYTHVFAKSKRITANVIAAALEEKDPDHQAEILYGRWGEAENS